MHNIHNLLDINSEILRDFPLLANQVNDRQTERIINRNIHTLKAIEDKMLTGTPITANHKSVETVINQVKYFAHIEEEADFNVYDLRLISYNMVKLHSHEDAYNYALNLLQNNWRSTFFNGLVFYLLNIWNTPHRAYRDKVSRLVCEKLTDYHENNRKILALKNHANFFEENGPLRMAALITAQNLNLFNAPTLIGLKPSSFSLPYYSDVILHFFRRKGDINIDIVESILEKHKLDRTKKLLFAYLVFKADRSDDQMLQTRISKSAVKLLGDISLASTWAPFMGATAEEIERLKRAKLLVNLWVTRRLINVFFEVCVQDQARKKYWIQILDKGWIKDLRIVGSIPVKRRMQMDDRIKDMFEKFFIETPSRASQTAAIILCVKNKVMVEFSDIGALYVYNPNREILSFIHQGRKSIHSTNDLKIPSLGYLDYFVWKDGSYFPPEEGRLLHSSSWQSRLDSWMKRSLSDPTINCITFSDKTDEQIFKEKPIPDQKITE